MTAESPRLIIVDDTDSEIQYTGASWFQDVGGRDLVGNFGPAYRSTLHGTKEDASLSYTFNGTSVQVMGSNNPNGVSWKCFADGISIGITQPYAFDQNHWVFCEKYNLPDGPHVIALNATVTQGQTFWFDDMLYTPSPTVALDQKAIVYENTDPMLQYGSGWQPFSDAANATRTTGSTLSFSFKGVSLSLYGFLPGEYPRDDSPCSYAVDGQPPVNFSIKGIPATVNTTVYNQKLLETLKYPAGEHEIVITYLGSPLTTPFVLDKLIIQKGTSTSTSTIPSDSSNHNNIISPVVGGVIGGLVLLSIGAFVFFYFCRRRKQPYAGFDIDPFPQSPNALEYSRSSNLSGSGAHNPQLETGPEISVNFRNSAMTQRPVFVPRPWMSRKARMNAAAISSSPSEPSLFQSTTTAPQSNMASSSNLIQHEDSGVRLPQEGSITGAVEIPPAYTIR